MSARERALAVLVQAAPVLGVPVWLVVASWHANNWDYLVLWFAPGVFMLAAGLAAAGIGMLLTRAVFVRAHAASSLRFHGAVAAGAGLLAAFILISPGFDHGPPTLDNPPKTMEAALAVGAFAYGFVLPVIEAIRALVCGIAAWRGPDRQTS